MLSVVNILIIFFIILIFYQLLLASNIVEGLENQYTSYDTNNPANALILSQKNAGNIAYLKERLDSYNDVHKQVQDLSGNVNVLQEQVNGLVAAQQQYATQMTGGVAPDVTGATTPEGSEPVDTSNLVTE